MPSKAASPHRHQILFAAAVAGAIDERTAYADGDIRKGESRFARESLPDNLKLIALLKA